MNTTNNTESTLAIPNDETTTTMRWETIRKKRGSIDSPTAGADKGTPAKRNKVGKTTKPPIDDKNTFDVKQSIQLAATKFKTFPERMMEILEKPNLSQAILWLYDGTAFALFPYPFAAQVLNVYFQGARWESFTRKLNRWGFKRIFDDTFDPEAYIYQHPMFQKGRSDLLKHVSGSNSNGTVENSKKNKNKNKEPQQQHVAGDECQAMPLHNTPPLPHYNPNLSPTAMGMMQMSLVNNNLQDYHALLPPTASVFSPQLLLANHHRNNNNHHTIVSVNPLLLGQQQQQQQHYLEQQQRFQQQNVLLAQLQAARGMSPQQQQLNQLSMQELHLLRAQNADRLLQQLRQQQQQQSSSPVTPRPAPSS